MKTKSQKIIRCGVIGYGGAFNMGNLHLTSMSKNSGVEVAAICELDGARREVAKKDWPQAQVYSRVGDMLRHAHLDLATIITPHNTHAKLAVQCLKAGVSAICEKPMAITSKEVMATAPLLVLLYDRAYVTGNWPELWRRRKYYSYRKHSYVGYQFGNFTWR